MTGLSFAKRIANRSVGTLLQRELPTGALCVNAKCNAIFCFIADLKTNTGRCALFLSFSTELQLDGIRSK